MNGPESFLGGKVILHGGDCLDVLKTLAPESVDACVTDPPYGLGFMGKHWDHGVPGIEYWQATLRVLKPGAHLVSFGGTRTFGRMHVAIEDAGFEVRDMIAWVYGSGFPKSLDVSKAIDKAAGAEREIVGRKTDPRYSYEFNGNASAPMGNVDPRREREDHALVTAPATDAAREWEGFGTAIKPAVEPIVLARKPLERGLTVAQNVLKWGCGALNIDGCRVGTDVVVTHAKDRQDSFSKGAAPDSSGSHLWRGCPRSEHTGRWPANLIHDGSDEVVGAFPAEAGGYDKRVGMSPGQRPGGFGNVGHERGDDKPNGPLYGDSGSAARFFYSAKADADDRLGSKHPTVKPLDLMQYLARLVTPPGGLVIDPFAGTGTTGEAAVREGFRAILIEREAEYQKDIRRRMALVLAGPEERKRESIKERTKDKPVDAGPLFASGGAS